MSTILWTVPRVEISTRRGLVVVVLRRGKAVVIYGEAKLTPIRLPAMPALPPVEPARPEERLTPADGNDYLRGLHELNEGAVYRGHPSEILERRPYFRRRGRVSARLGAMGEISVNGEGMSDAARKWLTEYAVPSLRREERAIRMGQRPSATMPRQGRW
jgi:hypothetical protein